MPSKLYTYKREYYAGRGTKSPYCPPYCPFNPMIECAQHGGNKPPNLPDCCTHCGWNPKEAEQRRIRLEAEQRRIRLEAEQRRIRLEEIYK